jgi:dienelactone hydrolase
VPARRTRVATGTVFTAALIALGGAFLTSGSSQADPIDAAKATPQAAVERISDATTQHNVGVTHFAFSRGKDRPLPTTVWYPATGTPKKGSRSQHSTLDALPAAGRYPIIVWSHGFYSYPEQQSTVTQFFAANGFVVVAPLYPYTKKDAPKFNKNDVPNQSLDASYVLTQVMEPGNPLAAHVDADRMAAVGHSGGGTTTNGLFTKHRDPRLKAGIVISGRPLGAYNGTPVPMLFVHGDKDPVVNYSQGREAYGNVPWQKAFLTMLGTQHGAGLGAPDKGHAQVMSTMLDFLRWSLDHDMSAKKALAKDGNAAGISKLETVGILDSNDPEGPNGNKGSTKPLNPVGLNQTPASPAPRG